MIDADATVNFVGKLGGLGGDTAQGSSNNAQGANGLIATQQGCLP
jgi:hypothetical protein